MASALSSAASQLTEVTAKKDRFIDRNEKLFGSTKALAKSLYDAFMAQEKQSPAAAKDAMMLLPELIIEDFDEEQVWAGVEMLNRAKVEAFRDVAAVDVDEKSSSLLLGDVRKRVGGNVELQVEESALPSKKAKLDPESDDHDDEYFDDDNDYEDEAANGLDEEEEEGDEEDEDLDTEEDESGDEAAGDSGLPDDVAGDPDFAHMSDSDLDDKLPLFENEHSEEEEEDDEETEEQKRQAAAKESRLREVETAADQYMASMMKNISGGKQNSRTEVDDKFFKLDDMEKFLEMEDAAEERRKLREEKGLDNQEDDDDDDGINYFEDEEGGEEDNERAKYDDYFRDGSVPDKAREVNGDEEEDSDGDEADGESDEEDASESPKAKKRDLLMDDEDSDSSDETGGNEAKSAFEERQERLQKKIKALENQAVDEKPWQLTGEIAGPARPENSLLQEHLEYDSVAKRAPVITEEVSRTLEQIIRQRIKDQAWDDVVRKVKPVEDPYEYKKRLILDEGKSKLSLAEIYEQEYLKQKGQAEEAAKAVSVLDREDENASPKEVEQIRSQLRSLFAKLDALSNFHYTPNRSLEPEIKVLKNVASIAMEEVAPTATSEATLLAPTEIMPEAADRAKAAELTGVSERTETDRKRERRKKKAKQKAIAKNKSVREEKAKVAEAAKRKHLDKALKSSSEFFSQLQNQKENAMDDAAGKKKKKLKENKRGGASFKL